MWRAVIGVLMFAYCLPAAYATLWPDTVRDLAASLSLARGEAIPLVGPGPINYGPYAGPAWIWLQAPPLVFFPSLTATSIYVAIVASLKFPALFDLGRRLAGSRLGICMAVAAAYPSFAVYQWLMFFHPNWVEVLVTATLILFLVADQRRSLPMLYGAVLMLGLAVQIHTTTLFYFPLAALVLYRIGVRGTRIVGHVIAMALLVLLWFAPVFFAPPADRGTMEKATERISGDMSRFSPQVVFDAMKTAYFDYPMAIWETYGKAYVPGWVWRAGLGVVGFAILAGMVVRLLRRDGRPMFLTAVALLAAAWAAGVAVRSYTSFYLVYFLLPLSALVMGLSLESTMSARWKGLRAAGGAAISLLVLSLVVAAYGARGVGRSGLIDSRLLAMGDLAHPVDGSVRATYVTVAARDELARQACTMADSTIALHGDLAAAMALSMGLDYRIHCPGTTDRFVIFGTAPGLHLAAIPEVAATSLGIAQGKPAFGLRLLTTVRPIYPHESHGFEKRFHYFEQLLDRKALQQVQVEFDALPHELVAIYRHKPYDSRWTGFSVTKDASAAAPAFATRDSWIYRADDSGGHWTVQFQTDAPQWVEVIAFPP